MFKIVLLLVASALLIEGKPSLHTSLQSDIEAVARTGNFGLFQTLLGQDAPNIQSALAGNVESLQKPGESGHVYGHSISAFKQWSNDNGKVSENSGGLEITNNDGSITRREFQP